jgi:hypothetical protein
VLVRRRPLHADVVRERPAGRAELDVAVRRVEGGVPEADQIGAEEALASLGRADGIGRRSAAPGATVDTACDRPRLSKRQGPREMRRAGARPGQHCTFGRTSRGRQLADVNEIQCQRWPRARRGEIEREVDAHLRVIRERHMLRLRIDAQELIPAGHLAAWQQANRRA